MADMIDWDSFHVVKHPSSTLRRMLYVVESAAVAGTATDLDYVYMRKIRAELERRDK